MSSIELTESQEKILRTLVNLYRDREEAVKGEDIAERIDRNPGTVRNQMQSLKALQLVEGVPGPKGGYKPTAGAYDALEIQRIDAAAEVPLSRAGEQVENANVVEIRLTSVHHPEQCRAEIHVQGSLAEFGDGDAVVVGPTPLSKLRIEGTVDATDDTNGVIVLKIEGMESPAEQPEK